MPQEVAIHDDKAQAAIERILKKTKAVKEAQKEFVGILSSVIFRDVDDHFQKEEGPDGKWHPWSAIYARMQDARGKSGNKLLQDNGRLRGSFMPTNWRKVGEGVLWFNPARTKKGFPYAAHHNQDAENPRTFMWTSDEAVEKIAEITLAYAKDKGY
jgi:phage gpG-like protein